MTGARHLRARVLTPSALLAPGAIFLLVFFAYPLVRTLALAFESSDAWTWMLTHPFVRAQLRIALTQAFLSVLLTLALAFPLAWLYHTRRIRFGRLHLALHAAPFVLPVFVIVFGIQQVLGRGGWVHALTGFDTLSVVGPMGAVVIAHAYYNYGFAARLLHATLARRPRRLEAAARTLGASPVAALLRVSLPALLPSILAVSLLVFMFAFTSFGVVLYMGAGQVSTLETLLYENMGGAFPRMDRAAALGIAQLALNVLLLAGYFLLRKQSRAYPREPETTPASAGTRHTALAWFALGASLLPALSVLTGGFRVRGAWSLEPWRALLDTSHPAHLAGFSLTRAIARSLEYAAWSTLGAIALTVLLAYGVRRLHRGRRVIEILSALPLGTSSLLIGFGFLITFGAGGWLDLRASREVIILAHILVAFPFTARALLPALDEHETRLDEAAALLGARPASIAWHIHLPMLRAPFAIAAGFAVAMSLGDFGASLVLMTQDNTALSVWIARHGGFGAFDPLARAQSVALAGALMILAASAYVVVEHFRTTARGAGEGDIAKGEDF